MGMQLKRGPEPKPQEQQGPDGSFLGGLAGTSWGMPCLLFVLVVLTMACFAGALVVSGNPPF